MRLPETAAITSYCSAPAFLNSTAFGVFSTIALIVGERDRLLVDLDLADLDQFFDERPQAEFLEIQPRPLLPSMSVSPPHIWCRP